MVLTFCATPLTLMVAPVLQPGMRMRIAQVPVTLPVTCRVVVSLTGYDVVWVTVIPRSDQVSTEGTNRFTISVLSLRK
ncbi:hypothetical protein SGLAM104S_05282 [Streptomyces glaucescens]